MSKQKTARPSTVMGDLLPGQRLSVIDFWRALDSHLCQTLPNFERAVLLYGTITSLCFFEAPKNVKDLKDSEIAKIATGDESDDEDEQRPSKRQRPHTQSIIDRSKSDVGRGPNSAGKSAGGGYRKKVPKPAVKDRAIPGQVVVPRLQKA